MTARASTERKLLDAADALLFTQGVAATPVDRILERAGVSPATLYRTYGSKDGLVAAALTRRHEQWLAVWDEAVDRAPDAPAALLAVFDALDAFHDRPDGARWCAFLGTAAELVDPPEALAAAVREDTASLRRRLRDLAAPVAGERGDELAEALVLVVSGHLAMRLRDGAATSSGPARAVAEALVDLHARA